MNYNKIIFEKLIQYYYWNWCRFVSRLKALSTSILDIDKYSTELSTVQGGLFL